MEQTDTPQDVWLGGLKEKPKSLYTYIHSPWWWVESGRKGRKGGEMGDICNTIDNKK